MMQPLLYLASICVTFIAVFLKGFQHKNVIGNHIKSVAVTAFFMSVFDVLAVALVIKGGIWITISSGIGAPLGMICAITFHNRIYEYNNKHARRTNNNK